MKYVLASLLACTFVCQAEAQTGSPVVWFQNCSGTIGTGGTAQNLVLPLDPDGRHGLVLVNIDASAGGGEPLWFSTVTTAAAATTGSAPLSAPSSASTFAGLTSWFFPAGSFNTISVVAATTGHKFTCWSW